jgi:cytochrome b subunit of formate dehydrogenase
MKLSKKSLLVRWAYLFDEQKPERTTVCTLFWRAFVAVPLFLPFAALVLMALAPVGLIVWLSEEFWPKTRAAKRIEQGWRQNIVRQRIADWKNKTCTLVELE